MYFHDYDSKFYPAMPVVEILIRRQTDQPPLSLTAIVDSGADASMIPVQYLRSLKARKSRTRWLTSPIGTRLEVPIYALLIQIGSLRAMYTEVVGTHGEETIIGRDILNQFVVTLDAPGLVVRITE